MARVAVGTVELHLPDVGSLKGKRHTLKGLKERVRARYEVSVAEVDHHDLWQRATLGIVGIAAARLPLEQTFSSIQGEVERKIPGDILSCEVEFLT